MACNIILKLIGKDQGAGRKDRSWRFRPKCSGSRNLGYATCIPSSQADARDRAAMLRLNTSRRMATSREAGLRGRSGPSTTKAGRSLTAYLDPLRTPRRKFLLTGADEERW